LQKSLVSHSNKKQKAFLLVIACEKINFLMKTAKKQNKIKQKYFSDFY